MAARRASRAFSSRIRFLSSSFLCCCSWRESSGRFSCHSCSAEVHGPSEVRNTEPNLNGGPYKYLSFICKKQFERGLVAVFPLGVASVPALNGDRRLVHLLDEPAGEEWSHKPEKQGFSAAQCPGALTSPPPPPWPPYSVAREDCSDPTLRICCLKLMRRRRNSSGIW